MDSPKKKSLSKSQMKGFLTQKSKLKIAIEEFLQNEYDHVQLQTSEKFNKKIRIMLVDALVLRSNKSISAFWYVDRKDSKDIWIVLSFPIIIKLDYNLLTVLIKFQLKTLYKEQTSVDNSKSLQDHEQEAFSDYIKELRRIKSNKTLYLAEKLKQILFLLVNQYIKLNYAIVDPDAVIPPSEAHLNEKVKASLNRIRSKFSDQSQFSQSIKFRIIPYLFQEIGNDEIPLRLKVAHSLIIKNSSNKHLFSLILLSTQFIEETSTDEILDSILIYEVLSIQNALKFNRGQMEREIYSIVSKDTDATETSLYKYFSREKVANKKSELKNLFYKLLFDKKVSILKVF